MRAYFLFFSFLPILLVPSVGFSELLLFRSAGERAVVYDDIAKLAWFANMSDSSDLYNKNYSDQITAISNMNIPGKEFYGLGGWHLATEKELEKLVQNNKLSDIATTLHLFVFQNTSTAVGRYENSINPPTPQKHHIFNLTYLKCCEPFSNNDYPYQELIKNPGDNDDIFVFAHPNPVEGNIENLQMPDTDAYGLSGWVVTGEARLYEDKLVPRSSIPMQPIKKGPSSRIELNWPLILLLMALLAAAGGGWWFMFKSKKSKKKDR